MNPEAKLGKQASSKKQYYIQGLWCPGCAKNLGLALNKKFKNELNLVDYSSGLLETTVTDFKILTESVKSLGFAIKKIKDLKQFEETQAKEYTTQIINLTLSAWTMMWLILLNLTVAKTLDSTQALALNSLFLIFIMPNLSHSIKIGFKSIKNSFPNIDTLITLTFIATIFLTSLSIFQDENIFFFDTFAMGFFVLNMVRFLEFKYSRKPSMNQQINQLIADTYYLSCKNIELKENLVEKKVRNLKVGMFVKLTKGDLAPANLEINSSSNLTLSTECILGERDLIAPKIEDIVQYGAEIVDGEMLGKILSFDQSFLSPLIKSLENQQSSRVIEYENLISKSFWFLLVFSTAIALVSFITNHELKEAITIFSLILISINFCVFYLVPNLYDFVTMRFVNLKLMSKSFLLRYGEIDSFVFDKTGTLQRALGDVRIVKNSTHRNTREIYELLGAIEEGLNHPIARAIQAFNQIAEIKSEKLIDRKVYNDKIIVTDHSNEEWTFGTRDKERNLILSSRDSKCLINLSLYKDHNMISYLKELIINKKDVHILTGDTPENLNHFLNEIGISSSTKFKSSMTNKDKENYVKKMNRRVLVLADGINDLEMVNQAYLSIAMPHSVSNLKLISDAYLKNGEFRHSQLISLERKLIKSTKLASIIVFSIYVFLIYLIFMNAITPTLVILSMLSTTLLIILSPLMILTSKSTSH